MDYREVLKYHYNELWEVAITKSVLNTYFNVGTGVGRKYRYPLTYCFIYIKDTSWRTVSPPVLLVKGGT